jgi:large subunit ribosomal protein L31e
MAEEKIYTIPLGEVKKKARVKRTPYAASLVREYLRKHTKSSTVKMGKYLNEELWKRGAKKPPRKIRVYAVKDGNTVKAELIGHVYEDFIAKKREKKVGMREKLMQRLGPKAAKKEEEEKLAEGKIGKEELKEKKEEIKTEAPKEEKKKVKTETE